VGDDHALPGEHEEEKSADDLGEAGQLELGFFRKTGREEVHPNVLVAQLGMAHGSEHQHNEHDLFQLNHPGQGNTEEVTRNNVGRYQEHHEHGHGGAHAVEQISNRRDHLGQPVVHFLNLHCR